ncbi:MULTISPECIES: DNA-binding transcriptional regulator CytR [Vibrio]|jgi:LacI family transcriptional regulator, repressor for deo operon, udp, cdd, tsx, nupC, and nupG|uniref:DNA-binding transcriptional regulator CytR n=2 Tax=Vibrio TaxID=662 RepID=A0A0P6ZKS0_VIBSP|nr:MULTISPECIES: DNA-binding transcriptional regulator CytR [Vibrio]HAH03173.1 DNA-binding transcriptional regulator CytR [Vibrio sp.]EAP93524.1 transcriptional repressor, LacI family [Vibrio splendidus 12B01]KPL99338.1 transcriptional regulator [Vibrio splendidus]MBB1465020.1 DNA-binding transcriptional regulator CytR [Vibrio sp. SG41-7]MBE8564403.1 DNA-binding transcriptional regulator CytR [Vibrio sp. OPT20]
MATMKDVAQLAGVSTATVSRALMNPEKVSVSTRKRVETAVLEAGYSPNTLARNLRRNESKTIITIVPDICDPYFAEIIRGIEDAAVENDYLVLLGDSGQQKKRESSFVNLVFTKQADGMLLLGTDHPFDVSKPEQKNLPPMVMACEFAPELELPTVHIDNLTSAFEAVNYLAQLGHKRIAQISGPTTATLCKFRQQGYQQALRRAGVSMNPAYSTVGDFTFEAGAQAVRQLLALPEQPTAIFCHNDAMAIGAIQEAKKLGLRVPQDLSIVGFDDIQFAQYCDPPLTTISQPRYEIGRQAMLMMLDLLKGNDVQAGSRLLEAKLVVRGSTAPPRM